MLIGVLTTSYPRFEGDYAGCFVRDELLYAQRLWPQLKFRVVVPQSDLKSRRPEDKGIEIIEAPTPKGLFYGQGAPEHWDQAWWFKRMDWGLRGSWALGKTALKVLRASDALLGHWYLPSGPLLAGLSMWKNKPFALVIHSGAFALVQNLPRPFPKLVAWTVQRACFIGASSPEMTKTLSEQMQRPVHWIGAWTSIQALLDQNVPPISLKAQPLALGFLGRRVPIKGWDLLIQALKSTSLLESKVILNIGGMGPSIRGRGIVDWGLLKSNEALLHFYQHIDVLVIPSRISNTGRQEGLPLVAMEAMSAGRPVLASRTGALPHLVDAQWLFQPNSVQALSQKLLQIVRYSRIELLRAGQDAKVRFTDIKKRWHHRRRLLFQCLQSRNRS